MSRLSDFQKKFNFNRYTGFSNSANNQGDRLLNKDGNFNVIRKGQGLLKRISPYHQLISMSWGHFVLLVFSFYLLLNLLFSLTYYLIGTSELGGLIHSEGWSKFIEISSFSAQTLTTVGYGRVNPIGDWANIIASFEALIGLMSFALITGLLYGRFSRPFARLVTSDNAIIAPFQNKTALMMRIANGRKNQLLECEANLLFNYLDKETNARRFINLSLEYAKINALSLSWTLVHPIDEESPLIGLDLNNLKEMKAEFIVMFKAYDDTYAQSVHSRFSYTAEEIIWGAKFTPMFKRNEDGTATVLELDKINYFESVSLS